MTIAKKLFNRFWRYRLIKGQFMVLYPILRINKGVASVLRYIFCEEATPAQEWALR